MTQDKVEGPLGVLKIEKLLRRDKATGKRTPSRTHHKDGLYLVVGANGANWQQRTHRASGRRTWMGVGDANIIGLKAAEDAARRIREQAASGIDPVETRRAEKRAKQSERLTVEVAVNRYRLTHEAEWRNPKTKGQWTNGMAAHVFPAIGETGVADLKTPDVLRVFQPDPERPDIGFWAEKTATAKRMQIWLYKALEATRGKPGGLTEEQRNPADWARLKADLAQPRKLQPVQPHAAMPYTMVPAFVACVLAAAQGRKDRIPLLALAFCALNGVRTRPVLETLWAHIDLDGPSGPVWCVPGLLEKSGEPLRVPLVGLSSDILRELRPADRRPDDVVFHGALGRKRFRSPVTLLNWLRRLGVSAEVATVHGFRSALRDWAGEETDHAPDICEAVLSHQWKGGVRGDYQRGDLLRKRRRLMEDWDAYITSKVATDIERAA